VGLVPTDYPDRLARAGLRVHLFAGWESHGGGANHLAVVLHHTASSSRAAPADDAAYCHHGSSDSPLYNVLVDRYGDVWVLAREKSNSSGKISSVAVGEALRGEAGHVSAGARGLHDDTSANDALFAISAQNDGSGEYWSPALVDAMATCARVTCDVLGLHAGHVTIHRVLTARKVDTCGPGCPSDWQPLIAAEGGAEVPSGAQMLATTPSGDGYWIVGSDGGVFSYGDAGFHGSMGGHALNAPIVGITATPTGRGYWLIAQDGGIFAFGDAPFLGAPTGQVR
jgi:N-acetylmuramoyl-L-alanine amidase